MTAPEGSRYVPEIQVHRSRVLGPNDTTVKDGIPVTTVARTLLDLGAVLRPSDLEAAIDRAERLRIFDLTAVVDALERARGRRGAKVLRTAIAVYRPSNKRARLSAGSSPSPTPLQTSRVQTSMPSSTVRTAPTRSTFTGRHTGSRSSSTASSSTGLAGTGSAMLPATPIWSSMDTG